VFSHTSPHQRLVTVLSVVNLAVILDLSRMVGYLFSVVTLFESVAELPGAHRALLISTYWHRGFPFCGVDWSIPFSGYSQDTTSLSFGSLSPYHTTSSTRSRGTAREGSELSDINAYHLTEDRSDEPLICGIEITGFQIAGATMIADSINVSRVVAHALRSTFCEQTSQPSRMGRVRSSLDPNIEYGGWAVKLANNMIDQSTDG
jgi:hypothetical protein